MSSIGRGELRGSIPVCGPNTRRIRVAAAFSNVNSGPFGFCFGLACLTWEEDLEAVGVPFARADKGVLFAVEEDLEAGCRWGGRRGCPVIARQKQDYISTIM
jgi:hypothetical protein